MHASMYMDFRLFSGISNTTYNNNLNYLKGIWIALKAKSYVDENIFSGISKRKQKPKIRRAFTTREAKVIATYIREKDELLFYGLILQYCCHIRPVELRRLRRRHFDFENRFVEVPGREAKNHEERFPAIPDSFIGLFRKEFWDAIPRNYLVFGKDWQPNRSEPCNKARMYKKHKKALQHLAKCGELDSLEGLTWYSWKDTGISEALEQLPLIVVQDQAG
ncbi:MAG: site-specific integrase, partial [Bacteroidota bacterium]